MARPRLGDSGGANRDRLLTYAAALYAVGFVIHTADHLRRGTDVVTTEVLVLGTIASALQIIAIGAVFIRHPWAPVLAVAVGLPDGIGIAAVHLLPHWSVFSDAFPGARGTGVTAFSWVAVLAEVLGALAFGLAGLRVARGRAWPTVSPPSPPVSTEPG